MPYPTDLDLTAKDVAELASSDALTAFLARLGYDTSDRALLSPEAVGLSGEAASAVRKVELLSEDPEQLLRVVFAQPKSLTAKVRHDLVRVLGKTTMDYLLVLASDFDTLEFVFLHKDKRAQKGPDGGERIQVVPKIFKVDRRSPTRLELRALRRFTWTAPDALEQFDKLRSVFDAAAYTGEYFQNRALFSDYFLRERLRDDPAWRENPSELFAFVRDLLRDAQTRWGGKDKEILRTQLLEPLFKRLGFKPSVNRPSKSNQTEPDYLLNLASRERERPEKLTAAFVYAWDRWLDGPDLNDTDTPEEYPGACVVTALDQGAADWIIVTNGKLWRLYSRQARRAGHELLRGRSRRGAHRLRRHGPQRSLPLLGAVLPPGCLSEPSRERERPELLAGRHPPRQSGVRQTPGRPAQGSHFPHHLHEARRGVPR